MRQEPFASIVTEALEGFASRRFESIAEVAHFLAQQPSWPKEPGGYVHQGRVKEILRRPTYAGYISIENWGIHMTQGKHEPLISLDTWLAVQARQNGPSQAPARKDLRDDFPLRGFVTCGDCEEPMTAAWSKGRNGTLYPYYLCDTRGCPSCRKSVRKETLERDFELLLRKLRPSEGLFNLAFQMFRDLWDAKATSVEERSSAIRTELAGIGRKIDQLIDRLVDATSDSVASAYDRKVKELETQRAALTERMATVGRPLGDFGDTYRTAFDFLANPLKLWNSPHLEDRRAVLRLVFAERLPYQRGRGYRTAQVSAPFRLLGIFGVREDLVEQNGIEPSTSCMPCKRSPN